MELIETESRKLLMERIDKGQFPVMYISRNFRGRILNYYAYVTPERSTRISKKLYEEIFSLRINPD